VFQTDHGRRDIDTFVPRKITVDSTHRSMMTGSLGVSFLLPQLFLSQHRLEIDIVFYLTIRIFVVNLFL